MLPKNHIDPAPSVPACIRGRLFRRDEGLEDSSGEIALCLRMPRNSFEAGSMNLLTTSSTVRSINTRHKSGLNEFPLGWECQKLKMRAVNRFHECSVVFRWCTGKALLLVCLYGAVALRGVPCLTKIQHGPKMMYRKTALLVCLYDAVASWQVVTCLAKI